MEEQLIEFIEQFENKVIDLSKELSLSNFNASISGNPEEFKKTAELELKLKKNIF